MKFAILMVLAFSLGRITQVYSQDSLQFNTSGFLDFNYYQDTRDFKVATLNILANLNHGFQYFSLTNIQGQPGTDDTQAYYSEQMLKYKLPVSLPLDLAGQYVMKSGGGNDILRFGTRLRFTDLTRLRSFFKKINLSASTTLYMVDIFPSNPTIYLTQLEHVYHWNILPKLLNDRLYINGFADQNLIHPKGEKSSIKWVTEHQVGLRILGQFYLVAEYRINEYLESAINGWGFGAEAKIKF